MTIIPIFKPLLRWPGGKSQLLGQILRRLPDRFRALHEPFAGGAALSFALGHPGGFLSDANDELINLYRQIKHRPEAVIRALQGFRLSTPSYYFVRALDRHPAYQAFDPVARAARYLFLNRTCFNGLMRVNAQGRLNASIGAPLREAHVFDTGSIWATPRALRACRLAHLPYERALYAAEPGDFVYLDPPYVPVRPAGDIAYIKSGFSLDDQGRLANLCGRLTRRGVHWMLSNADAAFIRKLYGHYTVHEITARRSISGSASARGTTTELLITNY